MVINFDEFVQDTERMVREVLSFAGADPSRYTYKPLPPGMKVRGCVNDAVLCGGNPVS